MNEFTIKLQAPMIQAILDVLDQAPMPQRVSRPITDAILQQLNAQVGAQPAQPGDELKAPEAPSDQPTQPETPAA
jgi:hypothetical protein